MKRIIFLIIILTLYGCAVPRYIHKSIDVNKRNSYVIVKTETYKQDLSAGTLFVTHLNGESLADPVFFGREFLSILPGNTRLAIRYTFWNTYADACLEFNGEAGKEYIVRKIRNDSKIWIYIEDDMQNRVGNACATSN